MVAPTGSGKTLSAFLCALDGFLRPPADDTVSDNRTVPPSKAAADTGRHLDRQDPLPGDLLAPTTAPTTATAKDQKKLTRVLYVSPLKALGVDMERNLRSEPYRGSGW